MEGLLNKIDYLEWKIEDLKNSGIGDEYHQNLIKNYEKELEKTISDLKSLKKEGV